MCVLCLHTYSYVHKVYKYGDHVFKKAKAFFGNCDKMVLKNT